MNNMQNFPVKTDALLRARAWNKLHFGKFVFKVSNKRVENSGY